MYQLPSNIEITEDITPVIKKSIADGQYQTIGVLIDSNTSVHCYPLIESSIPAHFVINIAAGERY